MYAQNRPDLLSKKTGMPLVEHPLLILLFSISYTLFRANLFTLSGSSSILRGVSEEFTQIWC